MSVQCHFLSTNTLQKKFFKLTTLVPIAAEMNLNIKRLQTLTASSVVDCTACRHSQLFRGAYREEEGLHIYTLGVQGFVFAQFTRYSPIQEENLCSWNCIEIVLKISPTLSYGCGTHYITKPFVLGHVQGPQKTNRQLNAPLNVAHFANIVASVKYFIISSLWAMGCCLKTLSEAQCTENKADQNAGLPKCKNTHLWISICSTKVIYQGKN